MNLLVAVVAVLAGGGDSCQLYRVGDPVESLEVNLRSPLVLVGFPTIGARYPLASWQKPNSLTTHLVFFLLLKCRSKYQESFLISLINCTLPLGSRRSCFQSITSRMA